MEDSLIVELKACQSVRDEHVAQRLSSLKSSRIETGLLVNFAAAKLHVKKYMMTVSEHRHRAFRAFLRFLWQSSLSQCLLGSQLTPKR